MNVFLWILQGLLGLAFIAAGVLKTFQPKEKLAPKMPWVNDFSPAVVKFVGIAEGLGGLGLILPAATGIAVVLTPIAAAALAFTMLLAVLYHVRKAEWNTIGSSVVFLILTAFVAWGRFGPFPL